MSIAIPYALFIYNLQLTNEVHMNIFENAVCSKETADSRVNSLRLFRREETQEQQTDCINLNLNWRKTHE